MKNTIKSFYLYLKRHLGIVLLLLLTIILAIAYILRLLTPEMKSVDSIPVPILESVRSTSFSDTEITINSSIELPTSLPVYSATPKAILVPNLVKELGLIPSTSSTNSFMSANKKQRLVFQPEEKRYEYRNSEFDGNFDASLVSIVNPNNAVKTAEAFTREKLGITNLKPVLSQLEFYEKEITHAESTEKEKANLVAIPFSFIINDSITFIGIQESYPLKIYVDSAGQITAFSLAQDQFVVGEPVQVKTITVNEIPTTLRNGQARILRIENDDVLAFSLSQVRTLTINDFSLDYRFSTQSNLVVPYLTITAAASQSAIANPSIIKFVVPAVRTIR